MERRAGPLGVHCKDGTVQIVECAALGPLWSPDGNREKREVRRRSCHTRPVTPENPLQAALHPCPHPCPRPVATTAPPRGQVLRSLPHWAPTVGTWPSCGQHSPTPHPKVRSHCPSWCCQARGRSPGQPQNEPCVPLSLAEPRWCEGWGLRVTSGSLGPLGWGGLCGR